MSLRSVDGEGEALSKGERIEARPQGMPTFYPGVITSINPGSNGTAYGILYDDGEKEAMVKRLRIRKPGFGQRYTLSTGTRIEAHFQGQSGRNSLYDGVISAVNSDGTYDITYNDGDIEKSVKRNLIYAICDVKKKKGEAGNKSTESNAPIATKLAHEKKDTALQQFKTKGVTAIFQKFDTDNSKLWRLKNWDTFLKALNEPTLSSIDLTIEKFCEMLSVSCVGEGDKAATQVEALLKYYDDEDNDLSVDLKSLGLLSADGTLAEETSASGVGQPSKCIQVDDLKKETKVKARYGGQANFYAGIIDRCNDDGSYNILYEDGDRELMVPRFRIRLLGTENSTKELNIGDVVDAAFKMDKKKLYKGKISKLSSDGTYEVHFDDGDKDVLAREYIYFY